MTEIIEMLNSLSWPAAFALVGIAAAIAYMATHFER